MNQYFCTKCGVIESEKVALTYSKGVGYLCFNEVSDIKEDFSNEPNAFKPRTLKVFSALVSPYFGGK